MHACKDNSDLSYCCCMDAASVAGTIANIYSQLTLSMCTSHQIYNNIKKNQHQNCFSWLKLCVSTQCVKRHNLIACVCVFFLLALLLLLIFFSSSSCAFSFMYFPYTKCYFLLFRLFCFVVFLSIPNNRM